MNDLRAVLRRLQAGELDVEQAAEQLAGFADLGHAKVDHDRARRCGAPEVIFCPGKAPADLRAISAELLRKGPRLLATRASAEAYAAIAEAAPDAVYHERARVVVVEREAPEPRPGRIAVLSAGTSDVPVAEEARLTAACYGHEVEALYDVGVAGLHRLLMHRRVMEDAHVLIVVAGMEGALASVVAGLTDKPVLAVPTSIGYGASFGGLAALLAMLNSCASRVAVLNIDNGFGAASLAASILRACRGLG